MSTGISCAFHAHTQVFGESFVHRGTPNAGPPV